MATVVIGDTVFKVYQATMLVIVINYLRLFALSYIVTMEIDTRVQCITAIHTTSRMLHCWRAGAIQLMYDNKTMELKRLM